ncbi:MAG: hypothetical protein H6834_13435 [Planctomycetes bacterium]|nr:hypothetical protein [Planctomycetota bacterium]
MSYERAGSMRVLITALALASAAFAQKTIIVDATGAGDHKTIQAAVDAARDGDRIIVRAGTYDLFKIVDKSVTLLGERLSNVYNFFAQGASSIENLSIGKRVTIDGLTFSTTMQPALRVDNCNGRVTLRDVRIYGFPSIYNTGRESSLYVSASKSVLVQDSSLIPALYAADSTIAVVKCDIAGFDSLVGHYLVPTTAGLIANNSSIDIAASNVRGGIGNSSYPNATGMLVDSSQISLRDSSSVTGLPAAIASGASSLLLGINATVTGELKGFTTQKKLALPTLTTSPAIQGQNYEIRAHGNNGDFFATFVAAPGNPLPVGDFGSLWLDPVTLVTIGAGVIDTSGSFALQIFAGTDAKWFALALDFQALVGTTNTLRLTNPATVVYR